MKRETKRREPSLPTCPWKLDLVEVRMSKLVLTSQVLLSTSRSRRSALAGRPLIDEFVLQSRVQIPRRTNSKEKISSSFSSLKAK